MKILIFGGTFNPPHLGHELMAELAYRAIGPDRMIIIPAFTPPHKEVEAGSPYPEQRLELCKAAFGKFGFAEVSDIELRRANKSYTVDTLAELRKVYSNDEFFLLIGSDSLIHFTEWRKFDEIMKGSFLVVVSRETDDYPELSKTADEYRVLYGAKVIILRSEPLVLSSSEIRAGNLSEATVSKPVLEYIKQNYLYERTSE